MAATSCSSTSCSSTSCSSTSCSSTTSSSTTSSSTTSFTTSSTSTSGSEASSSASSCAIRFYSNIKGDYRAFSNFYLCRFEYEGKTWPSSEHAFQAMKFSHNEASEDDKKQALKIQYASTPTSAKKLGGQRGGPCILRPDWENVKVDLMREILFAKFSQNEDLKNVLSSTGVRELREHTRRDRFWGDGGKKGNGKNMLGKLLMAVREELVDKSSEGE